TIKNIYYMLSYSFQILNEQGYKNVETEEFHNVAELCASILTKGISVQLKKGLGREYIEEQDVLSSLRGKIDITSSIKSRALLKKRMNCVYDEFSINTYMNKVLKTTVTLLLKADISKNRKKELKKLLVYFHDVDFIDVHAIEWNVKYNKNNQTYRMLISVCYLVVKGLLLTNSEGNTKLMDFLDEQRMCRLYEKFILEYYRKEHPELKASASQIPWQLDDNMSEMLPVMQTDIMLSKDNKVLIIDAKYYSKTLQSQYSVNTLHSGNLYQIFTYVKNKEVEVRSQQHEVAGMLLYAKTDELVLPNKEYIMSGNKVIVKTLDLDCDFFTISAQLDDIVNSYFQLS
ncbi:5-methylcytosine-specific restriction endonuclease system specificity protein McrC, partial [Anaerorhabdus sp.]|uniref:5-methylcytosine-specific restriction endonuclease system specificity protein McrC n=1 Tax=Anaerorhabdus sp. TaxID=1872524 RepID=UPI002FCAAE46